MKQISILIAALLFSVLFYEKSIGLNLSVFSIVTLAVLAIYNPKKFKERNVLLLSIAYIITGVLVFIQHSSLSIIANCIGFFTLVGAVSESKSSIYVHWLNGIYSTIAGFFHRTFEGNTNSSKTNRLKDIDVLHWAKLIGIPLAFVIVFVLLYKNGNPTFSNLVGMINFDFVNFQWLLFTVLGYYLFNNISRPLQVEPATAADLNINNDLKKLEPFSEETLKKEKQLGTVLLGLLSALILFYIITDIAYLTTHTTVKASAMSSQVHSGINTLIASIIIAIIIILYFFRGHLNFYAENKTLKKITYAWICLNVILIVLIAIKNQTYITSFGLTYKRIGVHIYILLTLIGLLTTFIKVLQIKNLVFLFRKNTQIAFIALLLCSTINWDKLITRYNLEIAKDFDIDYLITLSDRNALLLYQKKDDIIISEAHKNRIVSKYNAYINELSESSWQESTYNAFAIDNTHNNSK